MRIVNVLEDKMRIMSQLKKKGIPTKGLIKKKRYPKNRYFCACADLWTCKTLAEAKKDFDDAVSDEVRRFKESDDGIMMCDWAYGEIIDIFENGKDYLDYRKFIKKIMKLGYKPIAVNHDLYLKKSSKYGCALMSGEEGILYYSEFRDAIDEFEYQERDQCFCLVKIFEDATVRDKIMKNGKVIARK